MCSVSAKLFTGYICSRAWLRCNNLQCAGIISLSCYRPDFTPVIERALRDKDRERKCGGSMLESGCPEISILPCGVCVCLCMCVPKCVWKRMREIIHVGVFFAYSRGYIFQSEVNRGKKPQESPTFPFPYPLCTILSFSGLSAIMSPNAL